MRSSSGRDGKHSWGGWLVAALAIVAAALTGCSTASAPPATSAPSAPPLTSAPQVRPECAAVTAAARTVADDLTAVVAGQGSPGQLRTSAQNLSTALSEARTALGADGARLDAASAALQQLLTALQAQPVDLSAVRAAAQQVRTSLDEVNSVCNAPPPTSAPSGAPQVRPECAAVSTAARTVADDLTAFLAGQGSLGQVRTSAQSLSTALSEARTALGADGARLDAASAALQQLLTALQAQPVDPSAVRAAAQQLLTSLDEVTSVCSTASGTPAPGSTTSTPTS